MNYTINYLKNILLYRIFISKLRHVCEEVIEIFKEYGIMRRLITYKNSRSVTERSGVWQNLSAFNDKALLKVWIGSWAKAGINYHCSEQNTQYLWEKHNALISRRTSNLSDIRLIVRSWSSAAACIHLFFVPGTGGISFLKYPSCF